ncbi:MAG: hypothetical protein AKCLJLPJ_00511 [Fimbriimonadales bacterium]|nr:hypothetical protein [Fimbriimonadales bacterium]
MLSLVVHAVSLSSAILSAPVTTKVASAALFKNGYAVVVREAPLSGGETLVRGVPVGALGTLWLTASEGITLTSATNLEVETESERPIQSLDEALAANVGRTLVISVARGSETKQIAGKLLSADGSVVVVERIPSEATGRGVEVLQKSAVTGISAHEGGEVIWKRKQTSRERLVRVRYQGAASGKLYVLSLESGMTWAPAYAVDISDEKTLTVTGKATVLNDLADIEGVEVRLITGFPNIPYLSWVDPFTSGQPVQQFAAAMIGAGSPEALRDRNQGFLANQSMGRAGGGAFDAGAGWTPAQLPGIQMEDLFFYRLPALTLKRGERSYEVLFNSKSAYEHVYTLDVPDPFQAGTSLQQAMPDTGDVWHSLKFKNTSSYPWTTAPAVTLQRGSILGQDVIRYSPVGAEVLLAITKALDIKADLAEEQVSLQHNALTIPGRTPYAMATIKGIVSLHNRKQETVKMKVTKILTGALISADANPKTTTLPQGLQGVNSQQRVEWEIELRAGEQRRINYQYKLYVNL